MIDDQKVEIETQKMVKIITKVWRKLHIFRYDMERYEKFGTKIDFTYNMLSESLTVK